MYVDVDQMILLDYNWINYELLGLRRTGMKGKHVQEGCDSVAHINRSNNKPNLKAHNRRNSDELRYKDRSKQRA